MHAATPGPREAAGGRRRATATATATGGGGLHTAARGGGGGGVHGDIRAALESQHALPVSALSTPSSSFHVGAHGASPPFHVPQSALSTPSSSFHVNAKKSRADVLAVMATESEPSAEQQQEADAVEAALYSDALRQRFEGFAVHKAPHGGHMLATVAPVHALVTVKATKMCDLSDSLATQRELSVSAVAVNGAFTFADVKLSIKLPTCVVLDHASAHTFFTTLIPQIAVVVPHNWDGVDTPTVKVTDDESR